MKAVDAELLLPAGLCPPRQVCHAGWLPRTGGLPELSHL